MKVLKSKLIRACLVGKLARQKVVRFLFEKLEPDNSQFFSNFSELLRRKLTKFYDFFLAKQTYVRRI